MRRPLLFVLFLSPLAACGGETVVLSSEPLDTPTAEFNPYIPPVDTSHPYDTDDTDAPDTDVPDTDA